MNDEEFYNEYPQRSPRQKSHLSRICELEALCESLLYTLQFVHQQLNNFEKVSGGLLPEHIQSFIESSAEGANRILGDR